MYDAQYIHENGKNYMIIQSDTVLNNVGFQMKMLAKNNLRGILKVETRTIDGKKKYYYDISGKQQMSKCFDYGHIKWNDVKLLCKNISQAVRVIKDYMLDVDSLVLKPESIYMDITKSQIFFAYCPDVHEDFSLMLRNLFDYILEHFDHDTDRNVLLSMYEIYQKIIQNEYDIEKLEDLTNIEIIDKYVNVEEEADDNKDSNELAETALAMKKIEHMEKHSAGFYKLLMKISGIIAALSGIVFVFNGVFKINRYICGGIFVVCLISMYECLKNTHKEGVSNEIVENSTADTCCLDNNIVESTSTSEELMGQTEDLENCIELLSKEISLIDEDGNDIIIDTFPYIIGRIKDMCNLTVDSSAVSRMHARIMLGSDGFSIEDLNSKNGTKVNGEAVIGSDVRILNNADEIMIASALFKVCIS